MDFSFVESLLQNGASVKSSDKHGQTIFHEVARSWHTDVAQFLLTQGKSIRFSKIRGSNNGPTSGDPYWTSMENSLELIELSMQYK